MTKMALTKWSAWEAFLPLLIASLASANALPTTATSSETPQFPPVNSTATSIAWSQCPLDSFPPNLECANFSVPVNWDEPYGAHFDLGMVKLPAKPSNTTVKVGSLFINPGGPGGSATQLVAAYSAGRFPTGNLREAFDIIGLDPRGVGLSHQVKCNSSLLADRVSLFPKTEEELETLENRNRRLGESCRELTGPLLEHIDTISVAKDHEAVRIALDNQPINFVGTSYGSMLGAQYAALFPNNIRTLVLDGMLQHSLPETANLVIDSTSYEQVMNHFFEWAGKNDLSALKGKDVKALWTNLLEKAKDTPIPALSCDNTVCRSTVNSEEILFNAPNFLIFYGDYSPIPNSSWKLFSEALLNATRGDATSLSNNLVEGDNTFLSIGCLDWTHSTKPVSEIVAAQAMLDAVAPYTRGATSTWKFQYACLGWPVDVKNPPTKLDIKTETTVLVVTSTSDPETGMPWALGMMDEIEKGVLVVRHGDGHTSFFLDGETFSVIDNYLVTGKPPKSGIITQS